MQRRSQTRDQYEPLVTPAGWKDDERRLVRRLTQLMDTLFMRLGSMEKRLRALESGKGEQNDE